MADSFSGVSFDALRDGGFKRRPSRPAAISVRHCPGGDTTYVDYGGRMAGEWRGLVRLANVAALNSLATKIGVSGTLSLDGSSYTAVLLGLDEVKLAPVGTRVLALAAFVVAT